ncbi:MAG: 50S ribosomal protein L23 [Euryarchaeota archaeon]|nr:50S ribosomal protein L23 [Euryarchaeota archaeon]
MTRKFANAHEVVFHPLVTEKTMFNMDKNNTLEFLVHTKANKGEIKAAIEELFSAKVAKVNTRITKDGKRAVVKFAEGVSAEDVGMRIGVF